MALASRRSAAPRVSSVGTQTYPSTLHIPSTASSPPPQQQQHWQQADDDDDDKGAGVSGSGANSSTTQDLRADAASTPDQREGEQVTTTTTTTTTTLTTTTTTTTPPLRGTINTTPTTSSSETSLNSQPDLQHADTPESTLRPPTVRFHIPMDPKDGANQRQDPQQGSQVHFNLPEDVEKKEKEREERDKLAWDYGDRLKPRRSLNGTGIGEDIMHGPVSRWEIIAFTEGLVFIVAFIIAQYALGEYRDNHYCIGKNSSNSTPPLIWPCPIGSAKKEPENFTSSSNESSWPPNSYPWQLPRELARFRTRLTPWLLYTAHQLLVWYTLYRGHLENPSHVVHVNIVRGKLCRHSWILFAINQIFFIFHLAQTHLTYDGLAQDVSAISPHAAIFVLVAFLMMMEYKDRGTMFNIHHGGHHDGDHSRGYKIHKSVSHLGRKYHGYVFSWITLFVFWYHPLINTPAHIASTLVTWLITLQGCIMYTRLHLKRGWRFLLEASTLGYAGVMAYQLGAQICEPMKYWPQIVFGFSFVLSLTWIFTLSMWKTLPCVVRLVPLTVWVIATLVSYNYIYTKDGKPFVRLTELPIVPLLVYGAFVLTLVVTRFCLFITDTVQSGASECNQKDDDLISQVSSAISVTSSPGRVSQVLLVLTGVGCYVAMIAISVVIRKVEVDEKGKWLLVSLIVVFIIGASGSVAILSRLMPIAYVKRMRRHTQSFSF